MCASRAPTRLHQLLEQAKHTLAGGSVSANGANLQQLRAVLAAVPLEELGVAEQAVQQPTAAQPASLRQWFQKWGGNQSIARAPRITYLHIYEDAAVSMGIFCLPEGARIPLHNHPGMTVLSRVLYGHMHVKAYDWQQPDPGSPQSAIHDSIQVPSSQPRLAKLATDQVFTPTDMPAVLFPASGGNIHQFTALTSCAVLDVLAPPYAPRRGRDCTYYREEKHDTDPRLTLLVPQEPPEDFVVSRGQYIGARV